MKNLNYLVDHILHQVFKIILNIYIYIKKKNGQKTANPSPEIYISKIKNRISFKNTTGYYLELLTPEIVMINRQ